MINEKSILAIVPARSGSKGLPGKNIKQLCGKPLISWSIQAGLASKYIDELIVSTDSKDIAKIAINCGASVPFIRPSEFASDEATSIDVVRHALDFFSDNQAKSFDYIVLLEPTSPQREAKDIDICIKQLVDNPEGTSLVGVCKTSSQNPAFLIKKNINNFIVGYENSDMRVLRRQDIDDVYFFNGSIYISETKTLLKNNSFYHHKTLGFEFPKWKSIEIDDLDDFIMVQALMTHKGLSK
jgi:CMP-N,N'-diacetyllegionaminic acid synthase